MKKNIRIKLNRKMHSWNGNNRGIFIVLCYEKLNSQIQCTVHYIEKPYVERDPVTVTTSLIFHMCILHVTHIPIGHRLKLAIKRTEIWNKSTANNIKSTSITIYKCFHSRPIKRSGYIQWNYQWIYDIKAEHVQRISLTTFNWQSLFFTMITCKTEKQYQIQLQCVVNELY